MDCYRDMRDVRRTFLEFMERVPFYGLVVGCHDDLALRRLLPRVHRRVTTYGTSRGSDFLICMGSSIGSSNIGSSSAGSSSTGSSIIRSYPAASAHGPRLRFPRLSKPKTLCLFT